AFTDNQGNYEVGAPAGPATLTFRAIGYKAREVTVAPEASRVNAALARDVFNLEEVVVTGQATGVERRNLANAVVAVNAQDLAQAPPAADFQQQLAGRVPGAIVQANNGAPGGGIQIQLGGTNTILGDFHPLYVVDGVVVSDAEIGSNIGVIDANVSNAEDNSPNRLADLNPDDIANIEVLNGASAAAIYGSKAANGVIIITTKRGRVGRPQFSLTQRMGFSEASHLLGLRRFASEADAEAAFGPNAANYWDPNRYIDYEKLLAGNKPLSYETDLSMSGGTENTRYYVSGLVKRDAGIVTNTGYRKQSLRLNVDQTIGDRLKVSVGLNPIHSTNQRGVTNNDNYSVSYWMTLPTTPTFIDIRQNPDGTFPNNPFANSNVLQTAALMQNNEEVYRVIGSANVNWDMIRSGPHLLQFKLDGGIDYFDQGDFVYSPPQLQYEPADGLPGTISDGNAISRYMNLNGNLVHTYSPGDNLQATTSLGLQYEDRWQNITRQINQDLVPDQSTITAGTLPQLYQNRSLTRDFGFFAQEQVILGQRLNLTAALRGDQSSNNADPNQMFYYPKAAVSYRIPMGGGVLNEVKFRAAYGQSGNEPQYEQKFSELSASSIAGLHTFAVSTTVVDPDLHPERHKEIETGIDAQLFGQRASLSATFKHKTISDLLVRQSLPPSTGFATRIFNGAAMETNAGLGSLTLMPILGRNAQWRFQTTFTLTRTKVTSLPVAPFNAGGFGTSLGEFRIVTDYSPTAFWGRDTVAVANDPRCLAVQQNCNVGDRFVTVLGDANPDFRMGFTNDIRIGKFSLYALLDWQHGGTVDNLTGWLYDLYGNAVDFADPCTAASCKPGETLGQWRLRIYPSRTTRIWLENATFLKAREITVSYNLGGLAKHLFADSRSAQVSLSARNLFTLTGYSGMDPEVSDFGSQAITRNIDIAPYPPSRSFWFSLSVGF
ncbi:MAG: SusC/RagA family TonB-linked outer membrane protein, partial [Betaproteobacteria bacterium]